MIVPKLQLIFFLTFIGVNLLNFRRSWRVQWVDLIMLFIWSIHMRCWSNMTHNSFKFVLLDRLVGATNEETTLFCIMFRAQSWQGKQNRLKFFTVEYQIVLLFWYNVWCALYRNDKKFVDWNCYPKARFKHH